jgi:hypothetical protein
MPAEQLRASLVARYGEAEGQRAYDAMVGAAQGPFAPGARHHDEHLAWAERQGVAPLTKKPRRRGRRG